MTTFFFESIIAGLTLLNYEITTQYVVWVCVLILLEKLGYVQNWMLVQSTKELK